MPVMRMMMMIVMVMVVEGLMVMMIMMIVVVVIVPKYLFIFQLLIDVFPEISEGSHLNGG